MITNIIKNLIKDIPSVANSTIRLMCDNKDKGYFVFVTQDENQVAIVVTNAPKDTPTSIDSYKKQMIVDFLYMIATQFEHMLDKDEKPYTLTTIAEDIDGIINQDVVLWNMQGE